MTPAEELAYLRGRQALAMEILQAITRDLPDLNRKATALARERAEAVATLQDIAEAYGVDIDPRVHLRDSLRRLEKSLPETAPNPERTP